MEKDVFVLLSENEIVFLSNGAEPKKERFGADDYSDFDEYVAAVICNYVNTCGRSFSSVKLVLPSAYYNYGEQIIASVRSSKGEKYRLRNFSSPTSAFNDSDSTTYFEVHTDYECDGKTFKKLEDIPLLCKYLKRKTFLYWNTHRLSVLVSLLSGHGISVSAVVPDIHLCNCISKCYSGSNVVVSMFERYTDVCIFSGGHVRRMVKFHFGLFDLVRRLSDCFCLSHNNCRKLLEMYGFISVPQQYVHYEIAVPVFEDIKKNVKLTDLSYEIREMLKSQFAKIYDEIKDYGVESVVLNGFPIVDSNVLFQMMTKVETNCFYEVSYCRLQELFGLLEQNSYSETLVSNPIADDKQMSDSQIQAEPVHRENKDKENDDEKIKRPAWLESLMFKINQSKDKINALILE